MKTVERLAESSAKALAIGLRRGVKNAVRGQKKGVAVRGGARIAFDIDGDLVAEFDKDGGFTGELDLQLNGPLFPSLPAVGGQIGTTQGGNLGFSRLENFTGGEAVRMEVWCEFANVLAIEEDEENFGDADADLDRLPDRFPA